jgi:hypothetical protein
MSAVNSSSLANQTNIQFTEFQTNKEMLSAAHKILSAVGVVVAAWYKPGAAILGGITSFLYHPTPIKTENDLQGHLMAHCILNSLLIATTVAGTKLNQNILIPRMSSFWLGFLATEISPQIL